LYLPEEWCEDSERREKAKIPTGVVFETKPRLAASMVEQAAGWGIPQAPILADCAYGDNSAFRGRLAELELEYVVGVSSQLAVFGPETSFAVPERKGSTGRPRAVARPDRRPDSVRALAERLPGRAWKTLPCRTAPDGEEIESRFAFVRVVATHSVRSDCLPPRREWLIIEWPADAETPSDYWLANLPEAESRERLARLARLRWTIELDYRQLKGELGLDHYEGRSYLGFHHHCALVTCAHAFLTLERLDPKAPRPA
jgi:SRSO17 transposase